MSDLTLKTAWENGPGPRTKTEFLLLFLKGVCMGIADLIPGVSGGTIAFITGIYSDLLNAIASLNKDVLKYLMKFQFREFIHGIHLRFILPLAFGILSAIFIFARLMHYLITQQRELTWATFFGLIAASIVIVWKDLERPFATSRLIFILSGAILAYLVIGLIPVETPMGWWFIFICGIIGITAMILPGLSGSFLLLILGKYELITGAVKNPFVDQNLLILSVFSLGTLTGLLGFSKVLNYFMNNFRMQTMAFLTGILIGSMRKVWPWKHVLESVVIRGKVRVLREVNIMPSELNEETIAALILMIVGFAFVLFLEKISKNPGAELQS